MTLYHLVERSVWEAAVRDGSYPWSTRGVTLADEGFVHCSFAEQVAPTAARFYTGVADLVVLEIDDRLLSSPVVVEQLGEAPEPFPHIYGPLEVAAVTAVHPFRQWSATPQV